MGCIRKEWEIKILGDICETSSGGTPSKSHPEYYEDGNIPWLRSGEISQGHIYDTELYITEEGLNKSSAKIFPIDTVVIAMYGATVGQVGILKKEMSTNQAVCGIFPTSMLSPLFLVYYLKAKKPYFLTLAAGGAQPNISQNIIKSTPIPVPPIAEQEKIVAELDCLSGIIEKKKQQLKEYDALAQSIFYEMFGDPVENERNWDIEQLGKLCSLKAGKAIKANELNQNLIQGLYPCFGGNGIRGYIAKISHNNIYPIIGRQGALCGNVVLSTKEFYATEHAVVVQPFIEMNIVWLYYTLVFMNLNRLAQGVAQPGLSVSRINQEYIPLPPLSLQLEFASKIEAIEKQKALIKKSIEEVETLFNSRMEYYFN